MPHRASKRGKGFARLAQLYFKTNNLESMKGVSIPKNWERPASAATDAASTPLAEDVADPKDYDDDFWQKLASGPCNFVLEALDEDPVPPLEDSESVNSGDAPALTGKFGSPIGRVVQPQESPRTEPVAPRRRPAPPPSTSSISNEDLFASIAELREVASPAPLTNEGRAAHDAQLAADRASAAADRMELLAESQSKIAATSLAETRALAEKTAAHFEELHAVATSINANRLHIDTLSTATLHALTEVRELVKPPAARESSTLKTMKTKIEAMRLILRSGKSVKSLSVCQLSVLFSMIAVALAKPRIAGAVVQFLATVASRIVAQLYRTAPHVSFALQLVLGSLNSVVRRAAAARNRVKLVVSPAPPLAPAGPTVNAALERAAAAIDALESAPSCLMLASSKTAGGVCVDSACTHFMTNTRRGLIGSLRSVAPLTFNTASGPKVYDQAGTFDRTLYGANGTPMQFEAQWFFDESLPFDIAGKSALKSTLSAVYIDALGDSPPGIFLPDSNKVLTLARSRNKLEWLGLSRPHSPDTRYPAVPRLPSAPDTPASLLVALNVVMPLELVPVVPLPTEAPATLALGSSGVGMGKLMLDEVQAARLIHARLRHPSLRRMSATLARTSGLPRLTAKGIKTLNNDGCDVCNAYKIKLLSPKKKGAESENSEHDSNPLALLYYDQFGRVNIAAMGTGYHYAHLFVVPKLCFRWIDGSKTLDESDIEQVLARMRARLETRLKGTISVMRVDSLSTTRGRRLTKWFNDGLIARELTPPGQHEFLGDVEKEMYTMLVSALIAMRSGAAPSEAWFEACTGSIDSENMCAARLHDTEKALSGYERALGFQPKADDLFCFYAPGRFALDRDTLPNKWVERARAGYFLHRNLDFVLAGKPASAVWWDGRSLRTIVRNFYVCEERFFNLVAPNNKLLPKFPVDETAPLDPLARGAPEGEETDADSEEFSDAQEPTTQSISADALADLERECSEPPSTQLATSRTKEPLPISLTRARRTNMQPLRFGSAESAPDVHPHALLLGSDLHSSPNFAPLGDLPVADHAALVLSHPDESDETPRSVLNCFGGAYSNPTGISEFLRSRGVGVIDVDFDEETAGGAIADMSAPSLFEDLRRLCKRRKVAGIIVQQPCSGTSFARFRRNGPPILVDQEHPDGRPDIPEAHRREHRIMLLLAHHSCALMRLVDDAGGWFLAETPASRGDSTSVAYDPVASAHSNLFETSIYRSFKSTTNALHVTSAYCALRDGPQKMTDWLVHPRLSELAATLTSHRCTHGIGAHPPQPPPKLPDGKWSSEQLKVWPAELVKAIGPALVAASPTGGPSLQLGPDSPSLFCAAATEMYFDGLENSSLEHEPACFIAASSSWVKCPEGSDPSKWIVPQNELDLAKSPEGAFWEIVQLHEVDGLCAKGWLRKEVVSRSRPKGDRIWSSLFVYSLKQDEKGEWWARARLCTRGGGHRRGVEFSSKSTPTPDWSSVLTCVTIATVAGHIDFHFDLAQFFQSVECDAPGGPLKVRPPTRALKFCAEDDCEVVYVTEHWLQGSTGAGSAARREFDMHVAKIGVNRIVECPSTYVWNHADGMLRFTLHGDDGIGGAPSQLCLDELVAHIRTRWGDMRVDRWHDLLGFEAAYDRELRRTLLTAKKQIEALRPLVAGDVALTPLTPGTESLKTLAPCVMPEVGTPEYEIVQERVHFMRVAAGKMWHITRVRMEIIPYLQTVSRLMHVPTPETVAALKLQIWYLLHTKDMPKEIGGDPLVRIGDLLNPNPLPYGYELDMSKPLPAYLLEISDGDLRVAFSQCGVIVMFARVAIVVLAFHQHSIAQNAHESESFAASTGSSVTLVMREKLQSLGFPQVAPTPCFGDSVSTRDVAVSEAALKRSMHIRRRIYIMQWAAFARKLMYYRVKGRDNRADPLTKPWVTRKEFVAFRSFVLHGS